MICDEETAERDFIRMCEAHKILTDTSRMIDDDEIQDFDEIKNEIIYAITDGYMQVDTDGNAVYMPEQFDDLAIPEKLTFKRLRGQDLIASDKFKDGDMMKKAASMISRSTGCLPQDINNMDASDVSFCGKLMGFFINSRKSRSSGQVKKSMSTE